jgi:predicted Zn finger-like uncharacterized protein
MKIVCDSCSTKYSISDDKVRGKVFKIRCKKCSHIIVVRGTTDEVPAAAPETSTEAVWHLVIDGEQVGPLTDPEVRAQLARGEVSGENYIWKEGFADWVKLGTVPSFADAVAAAPPPAGGEAFPEATAVSAQGGEAGYFGGSGGHDARGFAGSGGGGSGGYASTSSSSGRARAAADEDAFSIPAVSASAGSTDLFGAASPMAPAAEAGWGRGSNGSSGRHDGGRIENLTAQRSENSVLFSLANLQSLAAPAAAAAQAKVAAPQSSEGSGLIDIRAMAASTLRAPVSSGGPALAVASSDTRDDDLPAFGGFSAAPLLLPMPSASGPPKWVYALIAMAVVLVVAAFALAYSIFTRPVIVEQPAPPPAPVAPAPAPAAGAPAATAAAAGKPTEASGSAAIAESDLPPREGGAAAPGAPGAGADKGPDKASKGRGKAKKPGGAAAAGATAVAAAPAAPAAPSEPERPRPAKGSIDDLLEGALGARRQPVVREDKRSAAPAPEPASSGPLAKEAVVKGMNGVRPKVAECYTQFKVPGQVMVNVVIGKNGKVTTATAGGKFAGTPTGACVEKAVKSASFPPSDGLTTMYPFLLR